VLFASETLIDLYNELCSDKTVSPIKITNMYVYTDSMVCLSWIRSYFVTHDKMQKRSVFIMNRLKSLSDISASHTITYRFIEGRENPSDCVTRPMSYKTLSKTCYLTGPKFLQSDCPQQPEFEITIPVTNNLPDKMVIETSCSTARVGTADTECRLLVLSDSDCNMSEHVVEPEKYSKFVKFLRVYTTVIKFISKLSAPRLARASAMSIPPRSNYRSIATNIVIRREQNIYFPDIVHFFQNPKTSISNIPNLVLQLNLFVDEDSIIRVKGKFRTKNHPILLSCKSYVSELIIRDLHATFGYYVDFQQLEESYVHVLRVRK